MDCLVSIPEWDSVFLAQDFKIFYSHVDHHIQFHWTFPKWLPNFANSS